MVNTKKVAEAEAEGAKISWKEQSADYMRNLVNDIRTDIVEDTKQGLHNGLNDIRQRLVEEAWYGEVTTDDVDYTKSVENTPEITSDDLYGENPNLQIDETEQEQEQEL